MHHQRAEEGSGQTRIAVQEWRHCLLTLPNAPNQLLANTYELLPLASRCLLISTYNWQYKPYMQVYHKIAHKSIHRNSCFLSPSFLCQAVHFLSHCCHDLSARNQAMGLLPVKVFPSTSSRGSWPVGVVVLSSDHCSLSIRLFSKVPPF